MKKLFIFCVMVLILCGCSAKNNDEHLVIDCNKKNELMSNGAILIDVRTEEEYAKFHLDNSINIPVDEILDGVMELNLEKDSVIILYCQSGNRSITGYRELVKNGYENVYDLGSISNCSD